MNPFTHPAHLMPVLVGLSEPNMLPAACGADALQLNVAALAVPTAMGVDNAPPKQLPPTGHFGFSGVA